MRQIIKLSALYEIEKLCSSSIENVTIDLESAKYFGRQFTFNSNKYYFRIAKSTPKKAGHFVTFWKRTSEGPTAPYHLEDNFKYLIIWVKNQSNQGFFLFNKTTLARHEIISRDAKEGKRGFRVYAPWVKTISHQASQSQIWQCEYFLDLGLSQEYQAEKFNLLLKQ